MAMQKFDNFYEKQMWIDTCRFWMMLKMKKDIEIFNRRYDRFLEEFKSYLYSMNKNKVVVEKEFESVQLSAYRTITESFFK